MKSIKDIFKGHWITNILFEIAVAGGLGAIAFSLLRMYSNLGSLNENLGLTVRYLVVLSPVFAIYFLSRIFFRILPSFSINIAAQIIIIFINRKKILETKEPLSWSDLTSLENYGIAIHYIDWKSSIILLVSISIILAAFIYCRKKTNISAKQRLSFIILGYIAVIFAAPQYVANITPVLASPIINYYKHNISEYYINYNWINNQIQNGIYTHLVQTSIRTIPTTASDAERALFSTLSRHLTQQERPNHIIFILCESCWHDRYHFNELFQPLRDVGMIELRGISPAYGGGTPNAEFEMYTALPAKAVLQGVLFQEYASQFSSKSKTIISNLQTKGYRTFAFHNFQRNFWKRDIVFQKFGFDSYRGLEDMSFDRSSHQIFPADSILFRDAFEILKDNINQPFFASLLMVSTHGGYTKSLNDNYGIEDYKHRLKQAILDAASFVRRIKALDPNVLLVLYGDHKPGLGDFFNTEGIFDQSTSSWEQVGDVPIYFTYSDDSIVKEVKSLANHLPFYCFSATVDDLVIRSGNPATSFTFDMACPNFSNYEKNISKYPDWIYRLSLFD